VRAQPCDVSEREAFINTKNTTAVYAPPPRLRLSRDAERSHVSRVCTCSAGYFGVENLGLNCAKQCERTIAENGGGKLSWSQKGKKGFRGSGKAPAKFSHKDREQPKVLANREEGHVLSYRGTSLIRKRNPLRTTIGP